MNNYIQIYKILDPSYCKDLIHRFEKNTEHHETHEQGHVIYTNKFQSTFRISRRCGSNYQMFTRNM